MIGLEHVWAQCILSDLHPTAITDGGFQALCPVCGSAAMTTSLEGELVVSSCEKDCPESRIADELHFRTTRNGGTAWSTWAPASLVDALAGRDEDPPSILARTDGHALLYPGRLHLLFGEPESGKGWLMIAACAEQLAAGRTVVYVDFEDTPGSIVRRLLALGVDRDVIALRFSYVRPEEPLTNDHWSGLQAAVTAASLVVVDGVTEALALQGLDLQSNADIATWFELLPRRVSRLGPAVVMIDHVVKDREARGRYAIGAQHKLAGVDVSYQVAVVEPFGRGRDGKLKISVTKDRPGHVRGFADEGRVAFALLSSKSNGSVSVDLEPASETTGAFRPTLLMERVSRAVEEQPGLTKRAVRGAVTGRANVVDLALEILVFEGFITARRDGQSVLHDHVSAYRADSDQHRVPPCPDRVPDTAEGVCPDRPSLTGPDTPPGLLTTTNRVPVDADLLSRADRLLADHEQETAA